MRKNRYADETQLLAGLRQKEEAAFAHFYQTNYKRLFNQLRYIVRQRETAEDLLQECFIRFRDNLHHYRPEGGRLESWMMRLCQNYAYSYLNNNRKRRQHYSLDDPETGFLAVVESSLQAHCVIEFDEPQTARLPLSSLKPDIQQVVRLHYLEGLNCDEIARYLGIPSGTVRTRIYQAKRQLRSRIADERYEPLLAIAQQGGLRL